MRIGDLFINRRGPSVAIDLGGDSVKVLRLSGGRSAQVEAAAAVALPNRFLAEGLSSEEGTGAAEALREALDRAGVKPGASMRVLTCIGGPAIRLRQIDLPPMPEEQIASALQFEAKKHIPFDLNDVVLDFELLERGGAGTGRAVLLVAAQKEAVRRRAEILTKNGLEPEIVDITPLAEVNFLESRSLCGTDAAVGYLDLGASTFGLSLWRRGGLFMHRYLGSSGCEWTRTIADAGGLSVQDAETMKVSAERPGDLVTWLAPSIAQLVQEVRQSISFYGTRGGRHGLGTLYIGGGNALLPGLAEQLSAGIGMSVELPDTCPPGALAVLDVRFVAALGLAARANGNGT